MMLATKGGWGHLQISNKKIKPNRVGGWGLSQFLCFVLPRGWGRAGISDLSDWMKLQNWTNIKCFLSAVKYSGRLQWYNAMVECRGIGASIYTFLKYWEVSYRQVLFSMKVPGTFKSVSPVRDLITNWPFIYILEIVKQKHMK